MDWRRATRLKLFQPEDPEALRKADKAIAAGFPVKAPIGLELPCELMQMAVVPLAALHVLILGLWLRLLPPAPPYAAFAAIVALSRRSAFRTGCFLTVSLRASTRRQAPPARSSSRRSCGRSSPRSAPTPWSVGPSVSVVERVVERCVLSVCAVCLVLAILTADYRWITLRGGQRREAPSLTAGVVATALLATRLEDSLRLLAFLAAAWHALDNGPQWLRKMHRHPRALRRVVSPAVSLVAVLSVRGATPYSAVAAAATLAFLAFVAPALMVLFSRNRL